MHFMAESAVAKGEALGMFEFWFNRYQTFIAAIIALVAAIIAAALVSGQLKEARRQTRLGQLDHLRQRSVELDRETTLIYELTSSINLMSHALLDYYASKPAYGGALANSVMQVKSAEIHMNNMIERFVRDMGPLWGDTKIQSARAKCRDDAHRFSVELAKFTNGLVPGSPVSVSDGDNLGARLVPFKMSVFSAAEIVHVGIVQERQRTGSQIEALERKLYS
jgi:hypothetical protein